MTFSQDLKSIVVCSSNFQTSHKQTATPVLGEITADQILDMPIVFADESPQEEVKQTTENSSYFIMSSNDQKVVVKEEPVDEDDEFGVLCPTMTRTAIPERLKIKQVQVHSITNLKGPRDFLK